MKHQHHACGAKGILALRISVGVIFSALFLLCLAPVFTGIINLGNACGMAGSALLVAWMVFFDPVQAFFRRCRESESKFRRFLFMAAWHVIMLCMIPFLVALCLTVSGMHGDAEDCDTVIVLGCLVKGDQPSKTLRRRINAAAEYLQNHPDAVCIVSGGQGENEGISEAACMKRELIALGIREERIYMEDRSSDTHENMMYSAQLIEEKGFSKRVAVVSSEFHLYRARMLAEQQGLEPYGIPSHTDFLYFVTYTLRETIGIMRAWVVGY